MAAAAEVLPCNDMVIPIHGLFSLLQTQLGMFNLHKAGTEAVCCSRAHWGISK